MLFSISSVYVSISLNSLPKVLKIQLIRHKNTIINNKWLNDVIKRTLKLDHDAPRTLSIEKVYTLRVDKVKIKQIGYFYLYY